MLQCRLLTVICSFLRYACVFAFGGTPARSSWRAVWELWWGHRKWLYNTAGNCRINAWTVWKFLEDQPFLPRCRKPRPSRSMCCKFTDIPIHVFIYILYIWSQITTDHRCSKILSVQTLSFQLNSHRVTWARKKCAVLTQELFSLCHTEVPFQQYYDWCIFDACGWVMSLIYTKYYSLIFIFLLCSCLTTRVTT